MIHSGSLGAWRWISPRVELDRAHERIGQAVFTTKPRQAQAMISRAVGAGVPFSWFTADEAYGQAKYLRAWLEDQDVFHVVAIRCSDTFTASAGEQRADGLIAASPGHGNGCR
jgi:SRSO17 transposase